jgi:hypothetical protein
MHGNRYMKIFVNKPLKNSKNLPEIIKSIKKTENNHKNSFFDLGRNPMEIVHGPLKMAKNNLYLSFDGFDTDLKFHFNL